MEETQIGFGEELKVQLEDCAPKRIEELEATLAEVRILVAALRDDPGAYGRLVKLLNG